MAPRSGPLAISHGLGGHLREAGTAGSWGCKVRKGLRIPLSGDTRLAAREAREETVLAARGHGR